MIPTPNPWIKANLEFLLQRRVLGQLTGLVLKVASASKVKEKLIVASHGFQATDAG
jgi:hypothetical protein